MSWRKCLVRGLVCTALAALAAAGLLYRYLTHPGAIRQQVVAQLEEQFIGANVTVESAHLNLFGGITLTDLRLIRRDDPDKIDFLYVPAATIYHDKEQLLDGKIAIRKVELHRPRLRMIRTGAIYTPMLQLLIYSAMGVLFFLVLWLRGDATPGDLVAYITAAGMLPKPIRQLSEVSSTIQKGVAAAVVAAISTGISPVPMFSIRARASHCVPSALLVAPEIRYSGSTTS